MSFILASAILAFITGLLTYNTCDNLITKPFFEFSQGLKLYKNYRNSSIDRAKKFGVLPIRQSLYILAIGEPQDRNHISAYGYKRKTTPWLSSVLKNVPNSILFSNAFPNHSHTVQSLTYALTSKSQYNSNRLQDCPSLIELANAAGYETYWVSNQVKISAWDTPVSLIASMADHQIFINSISNLKKARKSIRYDGDLLN